MAKMSKLATKAEAASRDRRADVKNHIDRLKGQSRSDVVSDRDRASGSPLGMGTREKKGKR